MAFPTLDQFPTPETLPSGRGDRPGLSLVTNVPPEPPQTHGGLFLVEHGLLHPDDLDVAVTSLSGYRPDSVDGRGLITYQEAELSTGFYHRVITGIPKRPTTEMMLDIGTPWWCDAEGFVEHFGRKVLDLGMAFRVIGSEQYHVGLPTPLNIGRAIEKSWSEITLPRSALGVLRIMDATDQGMERYIHAGESYMFGASRPAMYAPAVHIMAGDHIRTIHYSDEVDPGVSEQINFWHPDIPLDKLSAEKTALLAVGNRIIHSNLRHHYGTTLNKSLDSIIPQAMTGRTLLSGVGGRLAELSPEGPHRLVSMYLLSLVLNDRYREIYKEHEGTRAVDFVGAHMAIPDIWPMFEQRLRLIITQLQANDDDPTGVDYDRVKWLGVLQAAQAAQHIA